MQIPEDFKRFTRCFWQGSDREATNLKEWIANALRLSTTAQQAVIKSFLDQLLSSNVDGKELQRVWASGGSSYGIDDNDQLQAFLVMVRDTIGGSSKG